MSTPKTQPYLSPGRQTYNAPVTDWQGKRSNKSLGTKDVTEARAICRELNDLIRSRLMPDDPALSLVSSKAYALYYGQEKFLKFGNGTTPIDQPVGRVAANEMLAELVELRKKVKDLEGVQERYNALLHSIEGKRVDAERKSPTLGEVESDYTADISTLSRGGSLPRNWLVRFIDFMGRDIKIANISPGKLADFIAKDAAAHPGDASRAKKTRALTSRFFSWAAINHGILNPMDQVPTPRSTAEHDIQWHSLQEVEAVLEGLDVYWKALVATLAFAGLSAHELRGLRKVDIHEVKRRRFLRVAPHDERGLKTAKRRRNVAISKRLAPILDAHLAELPEETEFLFPAIADRSRTDMWHADTLSRHLNAQLPEDMNALSLRRTFGSLLIRSGKNEVEVSAAMGNSPEMVRQHYARILGGEVDIDF